MNPDLPLNNSSDCLLCDTEFPSKGSKGFGAITSAYLVYVRLGQPGHTVSLPTRNPIRMTSHAATVTTCKQFRMEACPIFISSSAGVTITSLSAHICKVICISPEEEVIGPDARRVIPTWTVVADEHPGRDWPKVQLPGDAVSLEDVSILPTFGNLPVAMPPTANPEPASLSLLNLRPESVT
jgi:hypothetical protein